MEGRGWFGWGVFEFLDNGFDGGFEFHRLVSEGRKKDTSFRSCPLWQSLDVAHP